MERLKEDQGEWGGLTRNQYAQREKERRRNREKQRRLRALFALSHRSVTRVVPEPKQKIHAARSQIGQELGLRFVEIERHDGTVSLPYVPGYFPAA